MSAWVGGWEFGEKEAGKPFFPGKGAFHQGWGRADCRPPELHKPCIPIPCGHRESMKETWNQQMTKKWPILNASTQQCEVSKQKTNSDRECKESNISWRTSLWSQRFGPILCISHVWLLDYFCLAILRLINSGVPRQVIFLDWRAVIKSLDNGGFTRDVLFLKSLSE